MFGKNIRVKKQNREDYTGTIKVTEIFDTFQGEGPFAGVPAVFVRFSGCSLKCSFCDTDFDHGNNYTVYELITRIFSAQQNSNAERRLVVITGGEPFLQYGLGELIEELNKQDFIVQIETAGTVFHKEFSKIFNRILNDDGRLEIVCSPKTGLINKYLEPYITAYKYILAADAVSEEDGLPNVSYENGKPLKIFRPEDLEELIECNAIWVNPIDAYDELQNKKNLKAVYDSCMKYGYRVGVQLHKIVGAP